ncbi:MAG: discoidin domain-containing protein [Prevotellaceae bacterium]|jgi:hypothetical protein|nr:discoidin domain-containing protein [Prevotellaceae bacterium]
MKHIINKFILAMAVFTLMLSSCDVAYRYDVENAYDDYAGDSASITVDTARTIDVSMYPQARIFPGIADTATENRIDTTLALDMRLRYTNAATMRVTAAPLPIYSTGLYAGAGELITITVEDNVTGLTAQIGSHAEDLGTASVTRAPVVTTSKALFPGNNTIRNPFGGYIWIVRNQNVRGSSDNLNVKISGAYRAPDFLKGKTDPARWASQIVNTTVPWLELRSKRVAFSVSRVQVESMIRENAAFAATLDNTLSMWDNIIEKYFYQYFGFIDNHSNPVLRTPEYPERVILDVQLRGVAVTGNVFALWEGQPVLALNSVYMMNELVNAETVASGLSTVLITSLGNNYQPSRSPFPTTVMQAAATIIPQYRVIEQNFRDGTTESMYDIFAAEGMGINEQFPLALSFAAADSSKRASSVTSWNLLMLIQLANYAGNDWEFLEQMYRATKESSGGYGGSNNVDFSSFYISLCAYFGKNMAPLFDHWAILLPDRARKQMDDTYPLLDKTIWKYNPLLRDNPERDVTDWDGSNYRYLHDRSQWTATALDVNFNDNFYYSSSDPRSRAPEKTIDGDKGTFWHSFYSPSPALPHYLVYDMKETRNIDGFYLTTNIGARTTRRAIVEIYTGDELDPYDQTAVWTQIAELRPFYEPWQSGDGVKETAGMLQNKLDEMYFDFTTPVNCRYLRLKFTEYDYSYNNWDANGIIPDTPAPTSGPFNSLGEFGTYNY